MAIALSKDQGQSYIDSPEDISLALKQFATYFMNLARYNSERHCILAIPGPSIYTKSSNNMAVYKL